MNIVISIFKWLIEILDKVLPWYWRSLTIFIILPAGLGITLSHLIRSI